MICSFAIPPMIRKFVGIEVVPTRMGSIVNQVISAPFTGVPSTFCAMIGFSSG